MMKQIYKECFAEIPVSRELIRKTELLMKQKKDMRYKHTFHMRYASIAVCLAVVMLSVIFSPKLINQTINNPSNPGKQQSSNLTGQQSAGTNLNTVIYVNKLGNMMTEAPKQGGPAISRIEKWTFKQYCDLLGFNPLPEVIPKGLNLIKNDTRNIYFQNNRRVDFYNTWQFIYSGSSAGNSKSMTINVNPSSIPYWSAPRAYQLQGNVQPYDVESLLKLGVKSQINGADVIIWYKDRGTVWDYEGRGTIGHTIEVNDYYCADFKYKGAGFTVTARNGITQQEFVQVLESIIR